MDWKDLIKQYPPIPEYDQIAYIASGDKKKIERLALGYLKHIYKIAKFYCGSNETDLEDYIQDGFMGLQHGIEKFDPTQNCKVITYVTSWIKCYIRRQRAINRLIRIPPPTWNLVYKFKKLEEKLTQNGIIPPFDTIADKMNITIKAKKRLWKALQQPVSQNVPTGEGDNEYDHADKFNLDCDVQEREHRAILEERIKYRLTDQERFILDKRQRKWTKKKIGKELNMEPAKVNQIEQRITELLK